MIFLAMVGLILLQWNAQSLVAHNKEFKEAINSWTPAKPDVICIQ